MRRLHHSTAAGWAAPAAALVWVLSVLTGTGCTATGAATRRGEGRVLIARGSPLLLEHDGVTSLVALAPVASVTGIGHPRELKPGDHVRYRWRSVVAGVRMAEE